MQHLRFLDSTIGLEAVCLVSVVLPVGRLSVS